MRKTQIHEFDPVIYPYKLWIIVNKTPISIADNYFEHDGKEIKLLDLDTKNMDAFAMMVSRKSDKAFGVVVYFRAKKSMTYEIVAHESSHAAKHLFEYIGADVKEHEPFEYVIGWIANCCDIVRRFNKNNKNQSKNE